MIIIGHRGASGYKPENTLQSFEAAINMGADMIELDVRRLKTGQVIVFHDDSLERTTDGKGKISQLSHDEIQSVDAGNGQTIPLLSDVLDLIAGKVAINIDL
jgi:glycerophosphoryl diester phosphodiesterase